MCFQDSSEGRAQGLKGQGLRDLDLEVLGSGDLGGQGYWGSLSGLQRGFCMGASCMVAPVHHKQRTRQLDLEVPAPPTYKPS